MSGSGPAFPKFESYRLFYQYPVYVSLLGFNLSNINGGKRLLAATAAFRNEPYSN